MSEPLPADVTGRIRAAIQSGNKIEAIKIYREATNADLKTAKEFIEAFEPGTGADPIATSAPAAPRVKSSGCGAMILASLVPLGCIAVWLLRSGV
jgi:hypothetical protein